MPTHRNVGDPSRRDTVQKAAHTEGRGVHTSMLGNGQSPETGPRSVVAGVQVRVGQGGGVAADGCVGGGCQGGVDILNPIVLTVTPPLNCLKEFLNCVLWKCELCWL